MYNPAFKYKKTTQSTNTMAYNCVQYTYTLDDGGSTGGNAGDTLYVYSYTDYDPLGLPLAGRNFTSNAYRYGYQDQFAEYDPESGMNNFELRQYDAALGRWFVPDPYRQHHSPCMAMGSNPANNFDPTGGFSKWTKEGWAAFKESAKFENCPSFGVNAGMESSVSNYNAARFGLEGDGVKVEKSLGGSDVYYMQQADGSWKPLPQSGAINKDYTIETLVFPALAAVKTVVNIANAVNNVRIQLPKPDLNQIAKDIKEWIGDDVKLYQNKAGEWIFQGKTNRIRMNNMKDHGEPPHFHLQTFNGKNWVDAVPGKHYYFFKNQSW